MKKKFYDVFKWSRKRMIKHYMKLAKKDVKEGKITLIKKLGKYTCPKCGKEITRLELSDSPQQKWECPNCGEVKKAIIKNDEL